MAGEHRLRRVLGPVTLTALGVGVHHRRRHLRPDRPRGARLRRPGAGAVVRRRRHRLRARRALLRRVRRRWCRSPGSAYTYAYATLGELFAWIIGWDLVLEYAVASSTVAHGWSHYFVVVPRHLRHRAARRAGPATRSTSTPPRGAWVRDRRVSATCRRRWSCSLITVILVIGIRESATLQRGDGDPQARRRAVRDRRRRAATSTPTNWHPFLPYGVPRRAQGRGLHLLRLHRLRLGLDARRGGAQPAARRADRHHRLARCSARSSTSWSPAC